MSWGNSGNSGGGGGGIQESDEKPLGGAPSGGGGQSWDDVITVHPYDIAPISVQSALGTQGAEIPIQDALAWSNPFYEGGDQANYVENCQRAVIAYEMRRRGYDVMAQPTYSGDDMPKVGNWQKAFSNAQEINVGSSNYRTAQANLEAQMKRFGNGSRGIVRIPGHVFNVENVGGRIRYVDAQTNTVYNSNGVFERLGRKASQVSLIRTDNLGVTDTMRRAVTPVTGTVRTIVNRRRNK